MRKIDFDESRAIMLETLHVFDRVCKEHNLRYLLAGGTLIGAMRHRGYIPWDDDIDVDMPREDYERMFDELGGQLIDGRYRIISYRDKSSVYYFAKFVDTRTITYETFLGAKHPTNLWVDVFPGERSRIGDPRIERVHRINKRNKMKYMIAVSDPKLGVTLAARAAKFLLQPVAHTLDPYEIARAQDETARSLNDPTLTDDEAQLSFHGEGGSEGYRFPWHDIFPLKDVWFEDGYFPGPADPDAMLTRTYGNWRWVPPKEQRDFPHLAETFLLDEGEAFDPEVAAQL